LSILTKAESRLLELGIETPEEIDLEAIAYDEGVRVKYMPLTGCEARLIGYGKKAIATIRINSDERRKRFSLAHELGHWNLHHGRSFECRVTDVSEEYSSKPSEEKEADGYASDLLMPWYLFKPLAAQIKSPNLDSVKVLADRFSTSLTATAIRLAKSEEWPVVVVCHSRRGREWFIKPRLIPDRWFPSKELSSDSIAFDQLFGETRRQRAQKAPAESWFDHFTADRYDIIEDAIKINDRQVPCFLWLNDQAMLEEAPERSYRRY
jgi:Zn-dependent peptidase ImmA (M78 family)